MVRLDTDAGLSNPKCSDPDPILSPSALSGCSPAEESLLAQPGHMGSDSHMASGLIGAVHMPGPYSHPTGHMACGPHHMGHMYGQGCLSVTLCQNREGAEKPQGGAGPKGGYLGGPGFGFTPYVGAEGPKNVQALSAWNHQVSSHEPTQQAPI